MSKPKKSDIRRGQTNNIILIPELCKVTGISDRMKSDFKVMRDLDNHMKMSPGRRVQSMRKFNSNLLTKTEVVIKIKDFIMITTLVHF